MTTREIVADHPVNNSNHSAFSNAAEPQSNTPGQYAEGEAATGGQSSPPAKSSTSSLRMIALASVSMALGAATMFALQPMIGKLLAPWLGSVPAVWTTCMLFFQLIMLGGYIYVHWLTRCFSLRTQLLIHGALVAFSIFFLPLGLPQFMTGNIPEAGFHAQWIFVTLALAVGAPAFVLAATAPLVQAWFGNTTHRLASNPYPLYVASNAGSLIGLLSYPFLIEPNLTLTTQRIAWSVSWLSYVILLGFVALQCWRSRKDTIRVETPPLATCERMVEASRINFYDDITQKLHWLALSFVPSSLLLGITSHITIDIAAMPMLWTIPLAIYLLTWTFSFADYAPWLHRCVQWIAPVAAIAAAFVWSAGFLEHIRLVLFVNMMALLTICWTLHRKLYESRPESARLTSFYIAIALGGALGGTFNALIAPLVFSGFAEYPIALAMSFLLLPGIPSLAATNRSNSKLAFFWQQGAIVAIIVLCTTALSKHSHQSIRWDVWSFDSLSSRIGWTTEQLEKWAEFSLPLIPAILLFGRPKLQAAAIGAALFVGGWINQSSNVIVRERSFFGVLSVREYNHHGLVHSLVHGGIMHGEQWISEESDRFEARSYYHKDGPLGDIMDIMARKRDTYSTAAIGLGTGSVAAYGQSNRPITFFEIDAAVESLARNKNYFTYVADCLDRGGPIEVRIGDARVTMSKSDDLFDLIVVDAFSSDAIPLHLITKEAIDGWFRHLHPNGIVAFHVSNRYIDLSPVLGNAAAEMGVSAYQRVDLHGDQTVGRSGSNWVVLVSDPIVARWFALDPEWNEVLTRPEIPVWTDDFASVLPVIRF